MPGESLLTRGKVEAQGINAAATYDFLDIYCGGDSTLVVQADMTGAANGDLGVQVNPYESDNVTIAPIALPASRNSGPTLAAGHVYYYGEFDVSALEKVRVRITNNNVGAQTITRASWRLQ